MTGEAGWEYPPARPYRILAAVGLLGALQCLGVILAPPVPDVNAAFYLTVGGISLTVSIVLATVGPRIGPRLLNAVIVLTTVLVCGVALASRTGEGQLLAGFSLTLVGVYTAYFLSGRMVAVQLTEAVILYTAVLIANPLVRVPWYGVVVLVVNAGATVVVARLVGHLRHQAVRDPLTGALNRQGLTDDATVAHDRDVRAHVPTTVVEIDLDSFKAYNDEHGHVAGDDLLAGLVDDWRQVLRRTDILARTGGDEFVIVLPATSAAEAEVLVQRMRAANPAPWTSGLAEWLPGEPLPEALRHADLAMYAHKPGRRGRSAS